MHQWSDRDLLQVAGHFDVMRIDQLARRRGGVGVVDAVPVVVASRHDRDVVVLPLPVTASNVQNCPKSACPLKLLCEFGIAVLLVKIPSLDDVARAEHGRPKHLDHFEVPIASVAVVRQTLCNLLRKADELYQLRVRDSLGA
jgi:hypothetical protein